MIKISGLTFSLFLALALHPAWSHVCLPQMTTNYTFFAHATSKDLSRIYLFPGTSGSAKAFLGQPPVQHWVERMAEQGHDVAVLNTPQPKPCFFEDGGSAYRKAFLSNTNATVNRVEAEHGPKKSIIVGGSYGGIHALMAFAETNRFSSWIASFPLIRLSALQELNSVGEVPQFDPFGEISHFRNSTGLITWGGADMRVDYRFSEEFYAAIKSPTIKGIKIAGAGHVTVPEEVNDILQWLDGR